MVFDETYLNFKLLNGIISHLGLVWFLLLLSPVTGKAQTSVNGRVTDVQGTGIKYANGYIIQGGKICVDFLTDTSGRWQVTLNVVSDTLQVRLSHVSCRDTTFIVFYNEVVHHEIHTIMDCNLLMPAIEIKDKKIGMVFHGDTIKFDIGFFSNGSEKTLGDILQKLPGITVNNQGQIEYNGKRVDGLLVEGKDIMNNQHKLATEGFSYKDILRIQIIENYQPFSQKLFQGFKDQVALNIELKDEAKSKLKGNAEIHAGYKYKQESSISLFNIGQNRASTNFFRNNNTGRVVISENDYVALQTNLHSPGKEDQLNGPGNIFTAFSMPSDVIRNNDFLLSRNEEMASTDKKSVFNYTILAGTMLRNAVSRSMQYLNTASDTIQIERQKKMRFNFGNIQMFLKSKPGKNIKTEFEVHGDMYQPVLNGSNTTRFGEDGYLSGIKNNVVNFSINPEFNGSIVLSKYWHLQEKASVLLYNSDEQNDLQDSSGILNQNIYHFFQRIKNTGSKQNYSLRLYYVSTYVDAGINQTYQKQHNEYHLTSSPAPMLFNTGTSTFQTTVSSMTGFVNLKYKQFSLNTSLSYPYLIHRSLDGLQAENALLNPTFDLKYAYGKVNFVLLQYNAGYQYSEHSLMNNISYLVNSRTLSQNGIALDQLTNSKTISISHLYLNLGNKSRMYLLIKKTNVINPIVLSTTAQEDLILNKAVVGATSENIQIIKTFTLRSTYFPVFMTGNYQLQIVKTVFFDRPTTEILRSNIKIGLETQLTLPFQFNTSIGLNQNRLYFGGIDLGVFNTYVYKAGGKYYKSNTVVEADMALQQNFDDRGFVNQVYTLNFKIEIPYKNKFNIIFQGNNLLNLNGVENNSIQNTEFYSEYISSRGFPGFLLVGIHYQL